MFIKKNVIYLDRNQLFNHILNPSKPNDIKQFIFNK